MWANRQPSGPASITFSRSRSLRSSASELASMSGSAAKTRLSSKLVPTTLAALMTARCRSERALSRRDAEPSLHTFLCSHNGNEPIGPKLERQFDGEKWATVDLSAEE